MGVWLFITTVSYANPVTLHSISFCVNSFDELKCKYVKITLFESISTSSKDGSLTLIINSDLSKTSDAESTIVHPKDE